MYNIHPNDYLKGYWEKQVRLNNIQKLEKCFNEEKPMVDLLKPLYVTNPELLKEEVDIIDYKHRKVFTFKGKVYDLDTVQITN